MKKAKTETPVEALNRQQKGRFGVFAEKLFTLGELREQARACKIEISQPQLTAWLRKNGYETREAWKAARHVRVWTKLNAQEASTAIRKVKKT